MANGPDTALRLMIVDDSVEDAEAIVSAMRNAGIAVRPLRPASAEELGTMLGGQAIDRNAWIESDQPIAVSQRVVERAAVAHPKMRRAATRHR